MAEPLTLVTITKKRGRESVDSEIRVRSLAELYDACRNAPASDVVRVSIRGDAGEVRLNFASFIHKG
jgi:hypothetical protein